MLHWILLTSVAVIELPPPTARTVDFASEIQPIFRASCLKCHGADKQKGGFRLDVKAQALKGGDNYAPAIVPGRSADSPLIHFVAGTDSDLKMPPQGAPLSAEQIGLLRAWIDQGAHWPDSASAAVEDRAKTHWAFQPLRRPNVPSVGSAGTTGLRDPIDAFLTQRLARSGLTMSREADRRTLIRRLCFTLHGLPPTPEQIDAFTSDTRPDAYERLVDSLLQSPHYGERWARHWLDVIAFGETHGFEVNTPRENAWPYRDYVIRAFNSDKPYAEFIEDQLAGDATGEQAATGFLVARAALLPGQIGRDVESMRLARQDELNDMVLEAGSAFLGLTIHCARCHDHKFDPISQRDYYALTAVFAGVRHGERPLRRAGDARRKEEVERLRSELAALESSLANFEPLANPAYTPLSPIDPRRNEERFGPIAARFVRFTIQDANLHPSLGLLEPCIDELEVFSTDGRNLALASAGAIASASGTVPRSDIHRLEHLIDGKFGNARSWISNEKGRGWVLIELKDSSTIDRIVWGRDREGTYTDRLATAYTVEAGLSLDSLNVVSHRPPLRRAVSPTLCVDRFAPVVAKRLRFTVLATSSLEPCLDELEVFTTDESPRNAASAALGAKLKASSTFEGSPPHRLEHLNDGRYGNGRSWISAEPGRGWVEVEFPHPVTIDRVVWARDRQGKFQDRLVTRYRIEVAENEGPWRLVASSVDRRPYQSGETTRAIEPIAGLDPAEARRYRRLVEAHSALTKKLSELTLPTMIYAGRFTQPDETYRLNRGDPMQRREPVEPGAIARLAPRLDLAADATEQERRLALAHWIADPANPLTARVLVNRLWHYHFGTGLVATPSDFGTNGARPEHPELLDWLATEFIASGGRIKSLQRRIVTSAAFRQASTPRPEALAVDSATRLIWRFPPRRLEAEAIRDSMLFVAGTLDFRMGGPGYSAFAPNTNYVRVYNPKAEYGPADWRRMIYQTKVRMAQDSTFGAFDCPDAGQNQPNRPRSTTPLQALNLFNSQFVSQQASLFADRLRNEAGDQPARQVRQGYRLAFGRNPDREEVDLCVRLVQDEGLSTYCRVLLNANEFLFIP